MGFWGLVDIANSKCWEYIVSSMWQKRNLKSTSQPVEAPQRKSLERLCEERVGSQL